MSTKDFNLSRDEFRNITRCLGNEEFRDLFAEYCKDLRDNRQQYEEELAILEAERGYDVKFLNPKPGYVIKTVVDGKRKGFINVCQCDLVQKPSIVPGKYEHETRAAVQWNIPYAQSQPRRDYDNKSIECIVYDVMFHPDSLGLAARNDRFRQLLNDTSLDAVEAAFKVRLDRANLRFPKLQYKGTPSCTVMRNKLANFDDLPKDELFDKLLPPMPPAGGVSAANSVSESKKSKPNEGARRGSTEAKNKENLNRLSKPAKGAPFYTTPEYKVVQRRDVEYEEMTNELDAKIDVTIPRELKITITLPLLKSAAECALDVTKATLHLVSEKPAKYKLELKLPYEVRENDGTAEFNVDERTLTVTLPVLRKRNITLQDINRVNVPEKGVETKPNDSASHNTFIEKTDRVAAVANGVKAIQPPVVEAPRKTIFPKFSVNKMENLFAFTLNVRNVDPATIEVDTRTDSVYCRFSNVGNGFFPSYYVFFVRFPNAQVTEVQHEEWDNNLIIQVTLNSAAILSYYAGPDEHSTAEYCIMEDITEKINKFGKEIEDDSLCIAVVRQEKGAKAQAGGLLSIEITKKDTDLQLEEDGGKPPYRTEQLPSGTSVDECDDKEPEAEQARAMLKAKKNARKKNKERSLSESFCDHLKVIVENEPSAIVGDHPVKSGTAAGTGMSPASSKAIDAPDAKTRKFRSVSECVESESMPSFTRKYKGILKRNSYDRSISECSSVDDLGTSVELGLPGSMSEECRKTVRFNDAIRKQMYRSNTSILTMKKRSQKKKEHKRRAAARRMSEGESTDNDEKDLHHTNDDDDDDDDDDNCLSSDQHDEKDAMENDSGVSFDSESGDKDTVVKEAGSKNRKNNNANTNNNNNNNNNNSSDTASEAPKSRSGQKRASDSKTIEFKSDMIFDIEM